MGAGRLADVEGLADASTRRLVLGPHEVAIPGLTDAHLHLADAAISGTHVDLTGARTMEEALAAIRGRHALLEPDAWLEGHGWSVDQLGGWPTADALESVAPGRRVALWAHDHHALWASHAALRAASIDRSTPDPPGGLIRRDRGQPTGVLHESAARLVMAWVPPVAATQLESAILRRSRELAGLGVVAVHDPGRLSPQAGLGPAIEAYRALADRHALPISVHACVRDEQLDAAIEAGWRSGDPIGDPGGGVRFGWLKLFADGTLGSRTAALVDPIEPDPAEPVPPGTGRGIFLTEPAVLAERAARAAEAGIATMIHAIGDRAVGAALDALAGTARRVSLQRRIEHVQLVVAADLERFHELGVAASVQPVHLAADAEVARRRWGARAERRGYAWSSLQAAGARLLFGTDAPIEAVDPWPGLELAVTRRGADWPAETPPFGPAEALSLDSALRAACVAPAEAAGERDRGRLVRGQRADLVVIDAAALEEPVVAGGRLGTVRPRAVLVGGVVVAGEAFG